MISSRPLIGRLANNKKTNAKKPLGGGGSGGSKNKKEGRKKEINKILIAKKPIGNGKDKKERGFKKMLLAPLGTPAEKSIGASIRISQEIWCPRMRDFVNAFVYADFL